MTRVKRGTISLKRRRSVLKRAKGYRFGRSKKEREARTALLHAGVYAYEHRRKKKKDFRRLWNIQINAGARTEGISYSRLIGGLAKKKIGLNRKMLADLAQHNPDIFKKVLVEAK